VINLAPFQVELLVNHDIIRTEITMDEYMRCLIEIRHPIALYEAELSSASFGISTPIFVTFGSLYLAINSCSDVVFC
jgi:hypothetical protein